MHASHHCGLVTVVRAAVGGVGVDRMQVSGDVAGIPALVEMNGCQLGVGTGSATASQRVHARQAGIRVLNH